MNTAHRVRRPHPASAGGMTAAASGTPAFLVRTALALLLVVMVGRADTDVPVVTRYVNDLAGVMPQSDVESLERTLSAYDRSTSNQFVVLVVPSLDGASIEDYAIRVAEKNGIGRKGKDNGLLLVVSIGDRALRFEVGYGLEGVLTDALTSVIIRDVITPDFRHGDYGAGIRAGMDAAIKAVSGQFTPPPRSERKQKHFNVGGLVIFLIILFLALRSRRRGGGGRGGGRGGGFWILPGPGFGGGFSGGGFSGGGFSGGGFSGGGGGFGGGGSSGSW